MTSIRFASIGRLLLVGLILWGLHLPLHDLLTCPDRISVLPNPFNATLVGVGQPTGVRFALAYPGREFQLAARKVLYFWGVLRDGWNVPRPVAVWVWRATAGLVPLALIEP